MSSYNIENRFHFNSEQPGEHNEHECLTIAKLHPVLDQ